MLSDKINEIESYYQNSTTSNESIENENICCRFASVVNGPIGDLLDLLND